MSFDVFSAAESEAIDNFDLRWSDAPFNQMEVKARSFAPSKVWLAFQTRTGNFNENYERFKMFGDLVLLEWNLVDPKGVPIPADGEGMNTLPENVKWRIVHAWVDKAVEVAGPLDKESKSGST